LQETLTLTLTLTLTGALQEIWIAMLIWRQRCGSCCSAGLLLLLLLLLRLLSEICWRCGVLQGCGCGCRCGGGRLLLLLLGCVGCGCGLWRGWGCVSGHCNANGCGGTCGRTRVSSSGRVNAEDLATITLSQDAGDGIA
jgi:hypothetical protein